MAARKTSQSKIDNLPEAERRKVIDALLAGASLRAVGTMAGCSHSAVQSYKRQVLQPAIQKAAQMQAFQPLPQSNTDLITQQTALTRDIVRSSPFQERLLAVWERIERTLDRAESAVQVTKDGDAIGEDLAVLAPLLNQAHKNLELLGKASGELLDKSATPNVSIQIVVPASGGGQIQAQAEAIDVDFEYIGHRR